MIDVREAKVKDMAAIINEINDPGDYFYQRFRKQRNAMFFEFWKRHREWPRLLECPEIDGHIVDFGCGSGHADVLLAANGKKIHGIDNSETGIAIANYLRNLQHPKVKKNVTFECVTLGPDTPEKQYDSVWSSHVFEHIEDPADALAGLKRITKAKAKMLLSVPFGNFFDHPTHIHHWYNEKEIETHFAKHVKVIEVKRVDKLLQVLCEL
ncbi:MAG: class I SAM-dependent methyltransferase [Candidatus Hermodarchaeia archaeon]|jgi:2-polyprenyl-6-hydroxyphenyl methylase/3-demethylubiquinone-9 3-methyltransferase